MLIRRVRYYLFINNHLLVGQLSIYWWHWMTGPHYVGLSRGNPWPGQTSLSSCRLFAFPQVIGHLSQISQLAAHPGGASRTGEQRSTEVSKGLLLVSLPAGDDRQLRAPIAGLNVFCFGWNTVRHYSCMNHFVVKMKNLSPMDMYVCIFKWKSQVWNVNSYHIIRFYYGIYTSVCLEITVKIRYWWLSARL